MNLCALIVGEFDKLRPTVNFADTTIAAPTYCWGPRIIPDYHFIYILSGTAELRVGNQAFELRSGDLGLYGGGIPMMLRSKSTDSPFSYYSIHFQWECESATPIHPSPRIRYCDEEQMNQDPVALTINMQDGDTITLPFKIRVPHLEDMISHIVSEYQQQAFGYEIALRGRMSLLLAALLYHLREEREPESKRKIMPALQLLEQHLDRVWSVSELAHACGYQTAYFTELFKKAMGATPKSYMLDQRIRHAKRLLLAGESIDVIASRLGYGSPHYFHRNFKEETGMTPSEFRMYNQ
ncbi:AraC-like DNA-binding protein [Paenibacillus cellulosilyticus]|uniref:AraC-like DNA-binding protein n=1 Tax=Paenibacillus cellulosilyticus TaxID=375489 RepID=A0A2V2YUR2_9BACL|nr:AraC-like DNA-binding protein [Paenibacillus cellulosilyticus]QKS47630.1 helix-turn-helix transcriptional regulator [Paenibacillus cellulosilyticus]